jgi:RNA polymerase sigma factor (sigma-70 family)
VGSRFQELSDADLLRLDDSDAFSEVYRRHAGHVYSWARARTGEYAADLTAEVFARAWTGRRRFKNDAHGSALPWLLGISRNVLRASIRKRALESKGRMRLGIPTASGEDPAYEAVEERLSFSSAVLRAFADLPGPERELLILRLVEERPYRDIARRLGCTPVAARIRVSRSLRRLHLLGGSVTCLP